MAKITFKGRVLRMEYADVFGNGYLKLNAIPENVSIDTSGFLAIVSFEV